VDGFLGSIACAVRLEQHLLPGLALVLAPVDAAVGVGLAHVADRRDPDRVAVARVDDDAPDVLDVGQPHLLPGRAAIL
jgi:hypothetical protein